MKQMKKVIAILLLMVMLLTLSSCKTKESLPEFVGEYSLGKSKSENVNVSAPTNLFDRPISGVELTYYDNKDALWLISYSFAAGVTLDIVLDAMIDSEGVYSDYKHIDHDSWDGEYAQDKYFWFYDDYSVELRYTKYKWHLTENRREVLNLFVTDKSTNTTNKGTDASTDRKQASKTNQYSGELIYEISDVGYYHLKLDKPIMFNEHSHEYIHFPNYKDGEVDEYLNSTITVEGRIEEDFHGLLCIYEPIINS